MCGRGGGRNAYILQYVDTHVIFNTTNYLHKTRFQPMNYVDSIQYIENKRI